MGRIFKLVALVFGALVVLLVVVLVGVGLLVDPNDYRDRITAAVEDATGRTLTLEGDIELNLFPRLGIALGSARFENADGFGDVPFARFDSAELRIGLLPLLSRRIEVDRAMLSGLRLNLARNAQGTTNWEDLAADADAEPDAQQEDGSGGSSDISLSVAAVEIIDAEVAWRDAMAGEDWVLSNFNLTASGFDPGRAFPLDLSFDLDGAEINVSVDAEMRALVDLAENRYRLDDLTVGLNGEGPGWPGGSGEARLEFASFTADIGEQRLELDGLELEMLGVSVSGNLVGENFMDSLSLAGGIEVDEFDPRELMTMFNAEIETADPGVLGRASASAEFYYNASSAGASELTLNLDDSTLLGSAGLRGERFEFDLTVDVIDIDRYLPPPAEEVEADEDTGSVDEIDLPLDRLRNFSASGNLAFGETKFIGLTFTDANFALVANNGRMTLTPTGSLYGGTIDGAITIEVQGDQARMALRQDLTSVDMAGVGRDLFKTEALAGTGNIRINLAAVGSQVGAILADLDGTASFDLTDGAWLGIDVWRRIRSAYALTGGPEVPPLEGQARTVFERIAVGGTVENSVMTTDEFVALLPFAAISGGGTVNLLTNELDLTAGAQLIDGPVLQQVPAIAAYAGATLPLTIGGTLDAAAIGVDWRGLIGQAARRAVQEEVDEAVEEVQDSIRDRLRERLD